MQLKVSVIQLSINNPGKFELSIKETREALERDDDLVILPEMWLTGFNTSPEMLALSQRCIEEILRLSEGHPTIIIPGTFPEKEGEKIYNTAFLIQDGKIIAKRRKYYLFAPMEENRLFSPGDPPSVIRIKGLNMGVVICYELRFPDIFLSLMRQGLDILAIPAQWPTPRIHHWRTLIRARAIETQSFVVASNVVGRTKSLSFNGYSCVISPSGEVVVEASITETTLRCSIEIDIISRYRKEIPVLEDIRENGPV